MKKDANGDTFLFIFKALWCAVAHRRDHLLIKRKSATELYRCPRCGVDHLKPRADLFT